MYDSTPVAGTVSVPSVGGQSSAFGQIGNEVILRPHTHVIKHVNVTMVSFACQQGSWDGSAGNCVSKPGSTFKAPITLNLYKYSHTNAVTGETTPGKLIMSVTKTFAIPYRPTAAPGQTKFLGSDGQLHNGIAKDVTFLVNRRLGNDVVWTVGYDTSNYGAQPLNAPSNTMDNLNVGLTPKARVGHDRYEHQIFWDTQAAGLSGGSPFVPGVLNLDKGWAGYVPAAQFSTR
jgi:hypothetical protein